MTPRKLKSMRAKEIRKAKREKINEALIAKEKAEKVASIIAHVPKSMVTAIKNEIVATQPSNFVSKVAEHRSAMDDKIPAYLQAYLDYDEIKTIPLTMACRYNEPVATALDMTSGEVVMTLQRRPAAFERTGKLETLIACLAKDYNRKRLPPDSVRQYYCKCATCRVLPLPAWTKGIGEYRTVQKEHTLMPCTQADAMRLKLKFVNPPMGAKHMNFYPDWPEGVITDYNPPPPQKKTAPKAPGGRQRLDGRVAFGT